MGTVLFWCLTIGIVYLIFKYPFIGGIIGIGILITVLLLKLFLPKEK